MCHQINGGRGQCRVVTPDESKNVGCLRDLPKKCSVSFAVCLYIAHRCNGCGCTCVLCACVLCACETPVSRAFWMW